MNILDWTVVAGAIALMGLVYWYFFAAELEVGAAATTASGTQEITITVAGGYDPATVKVKAGSPVRLLLDRQESSSCSEEIVFPDFGIRRFLPAFKTTVVELTAPRPGTYEFTCGMGMLHGKLVAE